jgi:carbon storage regulator
LLVLTRKSGQKIAIGNGIVITVLAVQGQRIRVGIDAPPSVSIRRSELPALVAEEELPDDELAHVRVNHSRRKVVAAAR